MLTTLAYWIPRQLRGKSKVGDSDWVLVYKPRWPIDSRFCEDKLSNVKKPSSFACLAPSFCHEKNRLRPFIKKRRSYRQDLNRKRYQLLLIYCTKTAQNSRFSHNSESLVRSALHFLMGSPATRQGHEKLVYRLIHLFSSTEIFSKRRKFVRVEGKPELSMTHSIWHFVQIDPLMHMGHNIDFPQQPRMRLHTVNVPIRRHPEIEALHYLLAPCNRSHDQLRRKC